MASKVDKKADVRVNICGVAVSRTSRSRVLEYLGNVLVRGTQKGVVTVMTPNPEQVVQAHSDDTFCHILNKSTVAVADGVGLIWGSRVLRALGVNKKDLFERIAGIELGEELMRLCAQEGLPVMLVGGRQSAARAAERFESRLINQGAKAGFKIGYCEGANDIKNESVPERNEVLSMIRTYSPKLVLVAFGAPWQEKWVWQNREELEKGGVKVAMVVGGAVDIWGGRVERAPEPVRNVGLEWLWRLIKEPWRAKRQLRLIWFVVLVAKQILGR